MKTNDNNYQGWTNYATWRINLEIFSDYEAEEYELSLDTYDLSKHLQEVAENFVIETSMAQENSLAESYAIAFLNQVNFYEIAQAIKKGN